MQTRINRHLRKLANAPRHAPVRIVGGGSAPMLRGQSYHYENKSGERIWHPNAYRAKFGRPIYCPSTIRVEVGADWIARSL